MRSVEAAFPGSLYRSSTLQLAEPRHAEGADNGSGQSENDGFQVPYLLSAVKDGPDSSRRHEPPHNNPAGLPACLRSERALAAYHPPAELPLSDIHAVREGQGEVRAVIPVPGNHVRPTTLHVGLF